MNKNVLFSSDKKNWETPQKFFDALNEEFHFTLDAAASHENHKCENYYTEEQDGLVQDWGGHIVWCNPPYGNVETGVWTKKCYEESRKPNTTVVTLIPARTDRASFHDYIYEKAEIRFIRGRLAFEVGGKPVVDGNGKPMNAPFPSMVVIFRPPEGEEDTK